MRRMSTVHAARGGQVAIYDALLFLMVVILVSVGMFLYSAKLTSEGAGFDERTYELLAKEQLAATMGLIVDVDDLYVNMTGGNNTTVLLLVDTGLIAKGPYSVERVLFAYSLLTAKARADNVTYDLSSIEPRVERMFNLTGLDATHYAWAFQLDGGDVIFFSDSQQVTSRNALPNVHYATSAIVLAGSPATELWYFLWPA